MPRPCKQRRICAMPRCAHFGPTAASQPAFAGITMSLDEYETIRLIDLEGMTQEQCAAQMNVARTTAQAIYTSARAKLAECLVHGKELQIAGGEYLLCDGSTKHCNCGHGCRHRCRQADNAENKEENEDENCSHL